jgi:hypothetical protein
VYAVLGLPTITGSCARGADPRGGFGLVRVAVTNHYHDLACESPGGLVRLVWSYDTLPIVTMSPIWVETSRTRPLPTITTAA